MKRLASFVLVLLLSGCAGYAPRTSGVLTISNQRTGETSTVQYRLPNGAIDPAGAWQLSYLMRDVRAAEGMAMDPRLFDFLDAICGELGLPAGAPVVITSGYRSRMTNDSLRQASRQVADNSYHMRGQAIDIKIPGVPGDRVAAVAKRLRRGGVAYYPSSGHVHIDVGPVRSWSAY